MFTIHISSKNLLKLLILLNAFENRPQSSLLRIHFYGRHAGALCDEPRRLCSVSLRHRHSKSSVKWFRRCVGRLQRKLWSVLILCRFPPLKFTCRTNYLDTCKFILLRPLHVPRLHNYFTFTLVFTSYWVGETDVNRSAERCDLLEISVPIRRAAPSLTISEGNLDYCRNR